MTNKRTSGLPVPVGEVLESGGDQAREDRLWANIRARRGLGGHSEPPKPGFYLPAPLHGALKADDVSSDRSRLWREIDARRRRAKSDFRKPIYAFSFGMAALAVALLTLWPAQPPAISGPVVIASPLLQSSGAPVPALEAEPGGQVIQLADRSEIRLDEGTRLEPLTSSGTRFELLLARGSAEFSVTPGGPRRWVIETGIATVEVIGTVFRVSRKDDAVEISVSRGVVLVRSEALAGRVQRVLAGQAVRLTPEQLATVQAVGPAPRGVENAPDTAKVDDSPDQEIGVSESDSTPVVLSPVQVARIRDKQASDRWRRHLQSGSYVDAYAELGRSGLLRAVSGAESMERLLELADVARLSGHPAEAVPALERALKTHAGNPQAALAAFTLGRVLLDQLHKPKEAAVAFERAITMRAPHALLADCHARLVEAHARAGDVAAADRAAARYRTIFPAGRHTTDLDRWTSE